MIEHYLTVLKERRDRLRKKISLVEASGRRGYLSELRAELTKLETVLEAEFRNETVIGDRSGE